MTRTRLLAAAIVLLLAGFAVDRSTGGTDPAIIDSAPPAMETAAELASLGPVELIANNYVATVTINCQNSSLAAGSFDASAIPGLPPGTTILTGQLTAAANWFNPSSFVIQSLAIAAASDGFGQCGSMDRNPVGTMTGNLSTGDTYTVTVNARPIVN